VKRAIQERYPRVRRIFLDSASICDQAFSRANAS